MSAIVDTEPSNPWCTVIICTWNRAALLPRALNSLEQQVEKGWEVVVVNDAGTDDTLAVLQNYEQRLTAMQVVTHTERGGTAAARNSGIAVARGSWVTFLDSDDEYEPSHLQQRLEIIERNPGVQFIHGGVAVIGNPYVADKNNTSKLVHIANCVVGGTFFIHRSLFATVGLFNESLPYADDAEFYERVVRAGIIPTSTTLPTYIYHRDVVGQLTSATYKPE